MALSLPQAPVVAEVTAARTGTVLVLVSQGEARAAEPAETTHKEPKCVVQDRKINFGGIR